MPAVLVTALAVIGAWFLLGCAAAALWAAVRTVERRAARHREG